VLVIEDEEPMAELVVEILKTAGLRGVIAPTAEEGLEALAGESFDAILCDLALPGMSGLSFRETVASRWPDLLDRVVLMSGFPEPPFLGATFLYKPFTRDQLLRVLGEAIDPTDAG